MRYPRRVFSLLRSLLVLATGHGYDRPAWMNTIHHKLAFRLHRMLPTFGIVGVQRVPVPGLRDRFMYCRAEDGGVAHHMLMYRQYEPFETELVQNAVKPAMTVYNIGTNLGYYAMHASLAAGPTGKVFAFEPEPGNLELLRKTISENACANILIDPSAVSEAAGEALLSLSDTNSGDHQLRSVPGRNQLQVPTTSLDAFLAAGNPLPDVIIMDVQGSELDVLRGASGLLRSRRPLVVFTEFWPQGLNAKHADGAREFLELLATSGFQLSCIEERHRRRRSVDSEWLLQNVTGASEVNLLAVRP